MPGVGCPAFGHHNAAGPTPRTAWCGATGSPAVATGETTTAGGTTKATATQYTGRDSNKLLRECWDGFFWLLGRIFLYEF